MVHRVTLSEITEQFYRAFLADNGLAPELRSIDLIRSEDQDIDRSVVGAVENSRPAPAEKSAGAGARDRLTELLRFYARVSGNRVRPADRESMGAVLSFPDAIIKTGILRALVYARAHVGSFAYCVKVIEQLADQGGNLQGEFDRLCALLRAKVQRGQLSLPIPGAALLEGNFPHTGKQ